MNLIILGLALGLGMHTTSFADGCTSLANTQWSGQIRLINNEVVPLNMTFSQVTPQGTGFYELKGTINNEAITSTFGCVEFSAGKIGFVNLDSQSANLSAYDFAPDAHNPTRLNGIGGRWRNSFVETTNFANQSYLNRK